MADVVVVGGEAALLRDRVDVRRARRTDDRAVAVVLHPHPDDVRVVDGRDGHGPARTGGGRRRRSRPGGGRRIGDRGESEPRSRDKGGHCSRRDVRCSPHGFSSLVSSAPLEDGDESPLKRCRALGRGKIDRRTFTRRPRKARVFVTGLTRAVSPKPMVSEPGHPYSACRPARTAYGQAVSQTDSRNSTPEAMTATLSPISITGTISYSSHGRNGAIEVAMPLTCQWRSRRNHPGH